MAQRTKAALIAVAVWVGFVCFVAWDATWPGHWEPAARFVVALVGLIVAGMAYTYPGFQED